MDSLALINGFKFNYSDDEMLQNKTIALLNIGASISNLSILEQGVPFLSRDILLGGKSFTKKIASDLEIDFKAAEKAKEDIPKAKAEKIKSALEVVLTQLTTELRKSFDYYESQSVSSVEAVYISGGGSLLKDFQVNLNNLLGIDVKKWDPLKKVQLSPSVDFQMIKEGAAQLAVAIGLSMR
jgi:type IV pilus assembly protein PilM